MNHRREFFQRWEEQKERGSVISVCADREQTQTHNGTGISTSTGMERIPLTSLLLSVVVSLSAGALRQYHLVNQEKSWTEAQKHCREKYTDLVTITDTQDQNDTERVIERVIKRVNPNAGRVWIGLRSTDLWVWSLSDHNIYTANESQYRNWETKQPQGDGDCVFMNKGGQWHDVTCSSQRQFICYNASEGFVPVQEQKNWTEAQRYCREKHTDLAIVRNKSENNEIERLINNLTSPNEGVWIGLHRLWVWSDNSTSTFTHWQTGEPNIAQNREDICTSIDIQQYQGRWTDEECTQQYPFVCYDDKLVLVSENLTWTAALRYCRDRDMDLVSVDSEEIQSRVKNVTASASSPHVWLGLRHSCVVGLWFWVNGQTLCYDQWAPGHGTGEEDCTTAVRSGAIQTSDQHWISLPGNEKNNFICSK